MEHSRHTATSKGLQWSARTDRGPVRPNNEDAFIGLQFDAREVHHLGAVGEGASGHLDFAFAVSDGMGGAMAGEHASRIAVQKITTLLPRSYRQSAVGLEAGFADVLEELFAQVHEALAHIGRSYEECSGMEATLSLCWFTPGQMYFGHIGDSRIYYLPAQTGAIKQLTEDDTHVGWLLRNGRINQREARGHPRRNLLQKALGGGNQFVAPQVGAVGYEVGDQFLLCTDGLVEGLDDSQLEELLRLPESTPRGATAAVRLVEESLTRNGRDNTTALVIRVI
ncbi:MAG TPA: protein phosphatase 2C domain-containing protein [Candidatus Baltobacteraceae bacterium]|jgi:protein phosphatase|nr:protein phosphatase 2C domain-containing protein [Candidatus Baltobacteraceae bacterium]